MEATTAAGGRRKLHVDTLFPKTEHTADRCGLCPLGIAYSTLHTHKQDSHRRLARVACMFRTATRSLSILLHMSSTIPASASASSALIQFSTCELSDALIKLGLPHGGHIPDISRQSKWEGSAGQRICGPAYTVKMVPASDTNAPKLSQHFVDTAESGSVIVIEAPPCSYLLQLSHIVIVLCS